MAIRFGLLPMLVRFDQFHLLAKFGADYGDASFSGPVRCL